MNTTDKIFNLMKENSVTAQKLSNELGLTKSIFTQWKKGLQRPSAEAVIKIADYFKVSTDYLLCKTDDPTPPGERSPTYADLLKKPTLEEAILADSGLSEEAKKAMLETLKLARRFENVKKLNSRNSEETASELSGELT